MAVTGLTKLHAEQ